MDVSVGGEPVQTDAGGRKWVGVHFDCCGIYVRIYRRPEEGTYVGRCPRCGRAVRLRVGPGGTASRFFRASS